MFQSEIKSPPHREIGRRESRLCPAIKGASPLVLLGIPSRGMQWPHLQELAGGPVAEAASLDLLLSHPTSSLSSGPSLLASFILRYIHSRVYLPSRWSEHSIHPEH